MENLRLYMATYNVGTSNPGDLCLKNLLDIKNCKSNYDFYVISLQEVKAQPQNMLMDAIFDDPWTNAFKEILSTLDYVKIKTIRLQGLVLNIFALKKHILNLRDIESDYTRTGLSGMWGNKGAVSIRLSIYGCSMCFINSHLSAHDNMLKDRISDYNDIIKDQQFHVDEHTEIFFHDYVFWMGDLNFRLSENFEVCPEEIDVMIQKGDVGKLFEHDQLRGVMRSGEAFSELQEAEPTFRPTFKFEVGKSYYDHKRKPAWCDRILYRVNKNNYENVTLDAVQKSYISHSEYVLSDHKPVTADFVIKIPMRDVTTIRNFAPQVFSDYEENAIQFENIDYWFEDDENTVTFKVNQNVKRNKDDWIGVFEYNFTGLDEYIIYEYVNKGVSPTPIAKMQQHATKHSIKFSELPSNRKLGPLCLIYFSQDNDNVQSVLGISNPFTLRKKDD